MQWVTRERPKIDRIAYLWLIARFIDQQPASLYALAAGGIDEAARVPPCRTGKLSLLTP
jgi:hypothetical protein